MRLTMAVMSAAVVSGVSSCDKNALEAPQDVQYLNVCDEQSALENFSISLSKAVYSYPEVREFLKKEALKRFDNDDEVFYPFIKDQEVGSLGTFREILVGELGSEEMMEQIEEKVSTLTILVSDATWFDADGFCLDRWDTSDSYVAITYQDGDGFCRKLFGDGCLLGTIEEGTIPGGPVLIVKENERVTASASTRGGEVEYSFLFDAYDASKNRPETRGIYSYEWLNEDQGSNSDIVSAMQVKTVNQDLVTAYNLFKNDPYACQNDYIFYGMTSNASQGRLRKDVKCKFFRFRLSPDAFVSVFDDRNNDDTPSPECNFVDDYEINDGGHGYAMQDSQDKVYGKLWADGGLEIVFYVLDGTNGNEPLAAPYPVKARDLFRVKDNVVKKEQWKATLIKWHITWRYSFNEDHNNRRDSSSLTAKWYYPLDNFTLPEWDLAKLSAYTIKVVEIDRGITYTKDTNFTKKKGNTISGKIVSEFPTDENNPVTLKNETGWSDTDEETETGTMKMSWKDENDILSTVLVTYSDKYIKSVNAKGFELYTYGSSAFQFTILPYRY